MPYLETFAKRAVEPFRPEGPKAPVEEKPPAQEEASAPVGEAVLGELSATQQKKPKDLSLAKAAPAPALAPKAPAAPSFDLGSLLTNVDPKKVFSDYTKAVASEFAKGMRLGEVGLLPDDRPDVDVEVVADYMAGRKVADEEALAAFLKPVVKPLEGVDPSRVKALRRADEVAADTLSQALKQQFVEAAGGDRKKGGEAYRAAMQPLMAAAAEDRKQRGDEGLPTLRDAELRLAARYGREYAVGSGNMFEEMGGRVLKKAVNLVEVTVPRRAAAQAENLVEMAKGATVVPALIDAFVDVPEDQRLDPTAIFSQGEAAPVLEGSLLTDDEMRSVQLEKQFVKQLPEDAIIDAIKEATYTKVQDAASGGPRVDFTKVFKPAAARPKIELDESMPREVRLGQVLGADPRVFAGIIGAESRDDPRAFAFNLQRAFEESDKDGAIADAMKKAGLPHTLDENGVRAFHNRSARKAYDVVKQVDPLAAVRAGAWGRFQVMGSDREGELVPLAKKALAHQGIENPPDALVARQVEAFFEQSPDEVSEVIFFNWWKNNPKALEIARNVQTLDDVKKLAREYHGNPEKAPKAHEKWIINFVSAANRYTPPEATASTDAPEAPVTPAGPQEMVTTPTLVEQREAAVRQAERGVVFTDEGIQPGNVHNILNVAADWLLPGSQEQRDETERKVEEATGLKMVMTESSAVDIVDRLDTDLFAAPGSANDIAARAPAVELSKTNPEMLARFVEYGQMGTGFGLDLAINDLFELKQREAEKELAGLAPEERAVREQEMREAAATEALRYAASMRTAGMWFNPIITSHDDLLGSPEMAGPEWLPDVTRAWMGAVAPKIEVLGLNGDQVIFRQEGGGTAMFSALDSVPVLGQAFNVGVLNNFIAPELQRSLGLSRTEAEAAVGMGFDPVSVGSAVVAVGSSLAERGVGGTLSAIAAAGTQGVANRDQAVDFTMSSLSAKAAVLLETDTAGAVLEMADEMGALPGGVNDAANRILATKDRIRGGTKLFVGLPVGLVASIMHPDALGGAVSAYRGAERAARTFMRVPDAERLTDALIAGKGAGGWFTARQELHAIGARREEVSATVLTAIDEVSRAEQSGDTSRVADAYAAMEASLLDLADLDASDAAFRVRAAAPAQGLDRAAGMLVGEFVEANQGGVDTMADIAKMASDPERSRAVASVLRLAVEHGAASDDAAKTAKAKQLDALLKSMDEVESVTLTPGATMRQVGKGKDPKAFETFGTADRVRAMVLAAELFDDLQDGSEIRLSVLSRNLDAPRADIDGMVVSDLRIKGADDVVVPQRALLSKDVDGPSLLDDLGPVDAATLETRLGEARLGDAAKERVRAQHAALVELHEDLKATLRSGDALDEKALAALVGRGQELNVGDGMSSLVFAGTDSNTKGRNYKKVFLAAVDSAKMVQGHSPARKVLFDGIGAVMVTSQARGKAYRQLALDLTAGPPEEAARFLLGAESSTARVSARRLAAAARSGVVAAAQTLVDGTPLIGAKKGSRRAVEARQHMMEVDGSDAFSFVNQFQQDVVRRIDARIRAVEAAQAGEDAERTAADVAQLRASRERFASDEWRASFIEWMKEGLRGEKSIDTEETAAHIFRDLPVALDPRLLTPGAAPHRPTQATKTFLKENGFFKVFGSAGEEERRTSKLSSKVKTRKARLSPQERDAFTIIIDQIARNRAEVQVGASRAEAEAAVAAWFRDSFAGIRRPGSAKLVRENLAEVKEDYQRFLDDAFKREQGAPIDEVYADLMRDPENLVEPSEVRRGMSVAVLSEGAPVGPFDVTDVSGNQVKVRRGEEVLDVTASDLRVVRPELEQGLRESLFKAHVEALDRSLKVVTEAEAVLLFDASKADLQALVAEAKAGRLSEPERVDTLLQDVARQRGDYVDIIASNRMSEPPRGMSIAGGDPEDYDVALGMDDVDEAEAAFDRNGINFSGKPFEVVYDEEGNVVAASAVGRREDTGEISFDVVVDESARRRGVARVLVERILKTYEGETFNVWVVNENMSKLLEDIGFDAAAGGWRQDEPHMTLQAPSAKRAREQVQSRAEVLKTLAQDAERRAAAQKDSAKKYLLDFAASALRVDTIAPEDITAQHLLYVNPRRFLDDGFRNTILARVESGDLASPLGARSLRRRMPLTPEGDIHDFRMARRTEQYDERMADAQALMGSGGVRGDVLFQKKDKSPQLGLFDTKSKDAPEAAPAPASAPTKAEPATVVVEEVPDEAAAAPKAEPTYEELFDKYDAMTESRLADLALKRGLSTAGQNRGTEKSRLINALVEDDMTPAEVKADLAARQGLETGDLSGAKRSALRRLYEAETGEAPPNSWSAGRIREALGAPAPGEEVVDVTPQVTGLKFNNRAYTDVQAIKVQQKVLTESPYSAKPTPGLRDIEVEVKQVRPRGGEGAYYTYSHGGGEKFASLGALAKHLNKQLNNAPTTQARLVDMVEDMPDPLVKVLDDVLAGVEDGSIGPDINIQAFRAAAPDGVTDEDLRLLMQVMRDNDVLTKSEARGKVAVDPQRAAEVRERILAAAGNLDDDTFLEKIDLGEYINSQDLEILTSPDFEGEQRVADFLSKLYAAAPEVREDLIAQLAPTVVDRLGDLKKALDDNGAKLAKAQEGLRALLATEAPSASKVEAAQAKVERLKTRQQSLLKRQTALSQKPFETYQRQVAGELDTAQRKLRAAQARVESAPTANRKAHARASVQRLLRDIADLERMVDRLAEEKRGLTAGLEAADAELAGVVGQARARAREVGGVERAFEQTPADLPTSSLLKGMTVFMSDAKALIVGFRAADASTGIHEMAHVLRRSLRDDEMATVLDWVNTELGKMDLPSVELKVNEVTGRMDFASQTDIEAVIEAEELFARAFERYLREGEVANSALQQAFKLMRDVMKRIYAAFQNSEIDVQISDEMYKLFDSVFGAKTEVSLKDVQEQRRYLDNMDILSRQGDVRRGGRIIEDQPVEKNLVDSYRQRIRSLDDYRSRGFGYFAKAEETADSREVASVDKKRLRTLGPGAGVGPGDLQLGPVSRRTQSVEDIKKLKEEGKTRVGGVSGFFDNALVEAARAGEKLAYFTMFGDDHQRWLRAVPPHARNLVQGGVREMEEFSSELSVMILDLSRAKGAQQEVMMRQLIAYIDGAQVRMQTGARRGQEARSNYVNSSRHLEAAVNDRVDRAAESSQKVLAADASRKLSTMVEGADREVYTYQNALAGFWKGLQVVPKGAPKEGIKLEQGLVLAEDVVESLERHSVEKLSQSPELVNDLFASVYKALTGTDLARGSNVDEKADALGALMLFFTGHTSFKKDGVVLTMADMEESGTSLLHNLWFGATLRKETETGEVVTAVVPGLAGGHRAFEVAGAQRTLGSLLVLGQSGYLAGVYNDLMKVGLGVTAKQARNYSLFVQGFSDQLSVAEVQEARTLAERFGLKADFQLAPTSARMFYVPGAVKQGLAGQMKQAMRQAGVEVGGESNAAVNWASMIHGHILANIIFGNIFSRQPFKFMSTIDIAYHLGLVVGGPAGVAAAARASALTVLSATGAERAAGVVEVGADMVNPVKSAENARFFKASIRKAAIEKTDEVVAAVTDFMGQSKFRAEVIPIMENKDVTYIIGGSAYSAKDLRRTFTRAGLYSNAFKQIKATTYATIGGDRRLTEKQVEAMLDEHGVSAANRQMLNSSVSAWKEYTSKPGLQRLASRMTSSTFEHGLESADAWSDLERTGSAVTLMEMGFTPHDAAELVVEAVYDYRGSMTANDMAWWRRLLMPFWSYRKNANIQAANMAADPGTVFRMTALTRALQYGTAGLSTALYETIINPYDINVTAMPPDLQDFYYDLRRHFEYGVGDDVSEETLVEYRAKLPEEAQGISDEELLDYSFDGWTMRNGYGGYLNVPPEQQQAFRAMVTGRSTGVFRSGDRVTSIGAALADRDALDAFVRMGAAAAVQPGINKAGLPSYLAKRPTIKVPFPTLDAQVMQAMQVITQRDGDAMVDPALFFALPDNFVMSAMDHAAGILTTSAALLQVLKSGGESEADWHQVTSGFSAFVEVDRMGGPTLQLVSKAVEAAQSGELPRVSITPITARLLEGSLGFTVPFEGEHPGESQVLLADPLKYAVSTTARVAGATGGDVFEGEPAGGRYSYTQATAAQVVVVDAAGRREGEEGFDLATAERKLVKADGKFDFARRAETFKEGSEGQVAYRPFLYGTSALYFPLSPLGQLDKELRRFFGDGSLEQTLTMSDDKRNEFLNAIAEIARMSGMSVEQADIHRTTLIDRPPRPPR